MSLPMTPTVNFKIKTKTNTKAKTKTNSNLGGHESGSDDNRLHIAPGLGLALHYLRPKAVIFMIIIMSMMSICQVPQPTFRFGGTRLDDHWATSVPWKRMYCLCWS